MKKRTIGEFCRKAVAVAAGAAIMVQAQVPTFVKAAEEPLYISEVYLSYGKTPEEAKKWLTDNGYEILDQDLNEGAASGQLLSYIGLASKERSVYLGYKTTTDKDAAITDMRAMNMNGGYSYEEYEKLLENKKEEINSFINDMKAALKEYRANYKKGAAKAKIAHDYLNTITDDDCGGKGLGDLLLESIKQEMSEDEYNTAPEAHVDMVTLVMQGNTEAVNDIMSNLVLAADTSDDTWLARLEKSDGLDGLIERYEKNYSETSESKRNSLMISDYDEKAKVLAKRIGDLREELKAYTDSELKADADEAAIKAYFEEHTNESDVEWSIAATKYIPLTEIKYEDGTLADLFTNEEYDFTNVDYRMELYPIVDLMSKGQQSLIEYIDLGEMVLSGNFSEEGWEESYKQTQETLKDAVTSSVYAGIDRSLFDPAGIALTSEAREIQNSTGASYTNKLLGIDTSVWQYVGYGSSAALLIAGASAWIYGGGQVSETITTSVETPYKTIYNNYMDSSKAWKETAEKCGKKLRPHLDELQITYRANSDEKLYPLFKSWVREKETFISRSRGEQITAGTILEELEEKDENFKVLNAQYDETYANWKKCRKEYVSYKGDRKLVEEHFETQTHIRSSRWKTAGQVLCIAGLLLALGTAVVTIYDTYKYYHVDYAPIPRKIVHESSDDKGRMVYTIYDCVLCNRAKQGFANDTLGDYGDMNGDVGKQWLALYTTKDIAAGDPLTSDIIAQKGSNKMPLDKTTGIKLFGNTDTVNIVSEDYGYNDSLGGLYIFCGTDNGTAAAAEKPEETPAKTETKSAADSKPETESKTEETTASEGTVSEAKSANTEEAQKTGSVVGSGTMVMSCGLSAAAGALICFLITRKKRTA